MVYNTQDFSYCSETDKLMARNVVISSQLLILQKPAVDPSASTPSTEQSTYLHPFTMKSDINWPIWVSPTHRTAGSTLSLTFSRGGDLNSDTSRYARNSFVIEKRWPIKNCYKLKFVAYNTANFRHRAALRIAAPRCVGVFNPAMCGP